MNTAEQRAMQMLGTNEETFKKIQEAQKLFPGLWDDDAFIEMWQQIPDDACSALFTAVDKIAVLNAAIVKQNGAITEMNRKLDICAKRLVHEYAENGSEATKDTGIMAVGYREFYAMLIEGDYDLSEYDREDIVELLRQEK